MSVIEKIEAQQKGMEYTDVWTVGAQLKEILQADPSLQELVDKDLDMPDMSLENCAKKIKAWADEQHRKVKGNCVCVPPHVAEGIIREFYGLPERGEQPKPDVPEPDVLDLADFL